MNGVPYILIAIIALGILAIILVFRAKKQGKPLKNPVTGLLPAATILIIGAIVISDRILSYSLIALSLILVLVDFFWKSKKARIVNGDK